MNKDFKIKITNLKVRTIIGVFEEEKHNPQTLLIDIKIKFDGLKAAQTDNLKDTIDYFQISNLIKEKVESSHFQLLEKLVDFVLKIVMNLSLVKEVKVTIHKPKALESLGACVSISSKRIAIN